LTEEKEQLLERKITNPVLKKTLGTTWHYNMANLQLSLTSNK